MGSEDTAEASVHGVFQGCHARLRWAELAVRELSGPAGPAAPLELHAANIVHQLRATLDNLVWQLVRAGGLTEPTRANSFPIHRKDSRKRRDRLERQLEGLRPIDRAAIERIQPWTWAEPSAHPLAILDRLAAADHQDLVAVGSATALAQTLRPVLGCVEATVRAFQQSLRTGQPPVLAINASTVMQWTEALRMRDDAATLRDDNELVQRFGRSLTSADLSPFEDSDLVHVFAAIRRLLILPPPDAERLVVLERAISQELALRKVTRFEADATG
jgi:hypothetical protein